MTLPEQSTELNRDSAAYAQLREAVGLDSSLGESDEFVARCRRGGIHALAWEDLIIVLFATGLVLSWSMRSVSFAEPNLILSNVTIGLAVGLIAWYLVTVTRLRWRLANGLPNSGLAQRLAEGPDFTAEFCAAVPMPWNVLFVRRPHNIKAAVSLLSSYATWFLRPTSRFIDVSWLMIAAGVLTLILLFGAIRILDDQSNLIGLQLRHYQGGSITPSMEALMQESKRLGSLNLSIPPLLFLAAIAVFCGAMIQTSSKVLVTHYLIRTFTR